MAELRWQVVGDNTGQTALFDEVERHIGRGEFRGMEFLHVNARSIINTLPAGNPLPFRHTINAYRGCSHACVYCVGPDTPVLMADGTHRAIAELRVGDEVYGTERVGQYRRFARTLVLAHWRTLKPAYRVTLADGTSLIASADHRFLTDRGWRFVTGTGCGQGPRPHLTTTNHLLGVGKLAEQPKHDSEYRTGYLAGIILGDAHLGHYSYTRRTGRPYAAHRFRLALADREALGRTKAFLRLAGVETQEFGFSSATDSTQEMWAIRNQTATGVTAVEQISAVPDRPSEGWCRGFLGGIFDAEGSYGGGILTICNGDERIISTIVRCLDRFGFDHVIESAPGTNVPIRTIRIRGGQVPHLRFFHVSDPAIVRKRTLLGQAIKNRADLRVTNVEELGTDIPMYDITTGTGDFIANGVVSHNCFARPTHDYLGLDPGPDFENKIVVKVNAVERLRAELHPKRWAGSSIAMGTNTDPYQRCEGKYRLTRGIVEVLGEFANPFSILTKSTLILRDLDVLTAAAARADVSTSFSIGTLDASVWQATEPGTPHPRKRMEAVARLNEAGVPCSVLMGPVIPGLSDDPGQIDDVVREAVAAGATSIAPITLHLRPGVKELFMRWLAEHRPDLVERYQALYPRSYAPKRVQDRISALVSDALVRYGRPAKQPDHRGTRPATSRPPLVQPDPPAQPQLWSGSRPDAGR